MDATTALGPNSRLLLVDGHSLAYRAFYALPVENFAAPDGQPTNAVHGFTSMLLQVVESEQPTHLAVAFDVSRETFRRAEFPDYKANRAKSPPEFGPQIPLIHEVLDAFGINHMAVDGYEADDIIATLATSATNQQAEVLILTGDRDSLQLVTDSVTVLYPRKGVSDLARMTPAAVAEKFGVTPDQYADLAALRGDASDNLPSIPGVGDKTAAGWLNTYGSLSGLIAAADQLKGKVGDNFRAHVAQVMVNRRLTELVRDVPLNVDVDRLHRHQGDSHDIGLVFDKLGFKQLRPRALRVFGASSESVSAPTAQALWSEQAWQLGRLAETLTAIPVSEPVGVWAQISGFAEIESVGLAAVGSTLHLVRSELRDEDWDALLQFLADPGRTVVVHGGKALIRALISADCRPAAIKRDTELIQYLASPGLRGLDLASSVERVLHRQLSAGSAGGTLFDADTDVAGPNAAAVWELDAALLPDQEPWALDLLTSMEIPLLHLLSEVEVTGIAVDPAVLSGLEAAFGVRMAEAERAAISAAGRDFNLGSPKQLQEVLFEERKLPTTKKIKTGYTTDAEALQTLYANTGDPVVAEILKWREVTKLRQSVATLIPMIDAGGRIHTTFLQTVAATGRLSSMEPNLQNIPVRTAEGRAIRAAFVAGDGYDGLLTADYSQIEMRIMAHLSEDTGLIEAFNSGEDLHTTVGAAVFGVEPEAVTADMRRRVKAMSYGLAYGLSSYGLSQQLGIEPREATLLMENYLERFGGVQKYLQQVVEKARADGYTETMFGRRRYLPGLTDPSQQVRAAAERMALNSPIQGTAADIIKIAMIRVAAELRQAGLKSRLVLQVHDELVLEVVRNEIDQVKELVAAGMSGAANLSVPLDVSMGYGANWDEAAH